MKALSYIISLIFLWSTGAMAFAPGFLQVAGGGGGVASLINDSNIVGVWRFENNPNDSSSNGNNLTNSNSTYITSSPTPQEGTYAAEGGVAYNKFFYSSTVGITNDFSYGGWFYFKANSVDVSLGGKHIAGDGNYGWQLIRGSGGAITLQYSSDGSTFYAASTASSQVPTVDTWYHIVVTYNNSIIRLYINGSEVTSSDFPKTYSSGINNSAVANFAVAYSYGQGNAIYGVWDDVFLFDRALTASEISGIYNNDL